MALITLEELRSLQRSEIPTAEKLVSLVRSLNEEFQDQRNYLLNYEENLKEAGMDPKWLGKQGNQASFVARSMAGARWKLTSSSSREMIRSVNETEREDAFLKLKIPKPPAGIIGSGFDSKTTRLFPGKSFVFNLNLSFSLFEFHIDQAKMRGKKKSKLFPFETF